MRRSVRTAVFALAFPVFLQTSPSKSPPNAPVVHVTESFLQGQVLSRGEFAEYMLQGPRVDFSTAEVEITVDERGRVEKLQVIDSHRLFRLASAEYVRGWTFQPFVTAAGDRRKMRGRVKVYIPLLPSAVLIGEDLPLVRALKTGAFEVEGEMLSKTDFETWLADKNLRSRLPTLHMMLDDPDQAGAIALFLKSLGSRRLCFHFSDRAP